LASSGIAEVGVGLGVELLDPDDVALVCSVELAVDVAVELAVGAIVICQLSCCSSEIGDRILVVASGLIE
jgi:hypothetical protein